MPRAAILDRIRGNNTPGESIIEQSPTRADAKHNVTKINGWVFSFSDIETDVAVLPWQSALTLHLFDAALLDMMS